MHIVPTRAHANEELRLNYKYFRIDDPVQPTLVYRILPSDYTIGLDRFGVGFFSKSGPSHVYDCNNEIVEVDVVQLVETEERCEDKVGGPLVFKTVEIGETLELRGWSQDSTLAATWNGENFDVIGLFDHLTEAQKVLVAEKVGSLTNGVMLQPIKDELNYPDSFSINIDAHIVDYIEADNQVGVAIEVEALAAEVYNELIQFR